MKSVRVRAQKRNGEGTTAGETGYEPCLHGRQADDGCDESKRVLHPLHLSEAVGSVGSGKEGYEAVQLARALLVALAAVAVTQLGVERGLDMMDPVHEGVDVCQEGL